MSWVGTVLSFLALSLAPATPRIFTPCEVASEILQNTATLIRCSPEDVARLVCIASLHNYDTSYSFKINGNETAVGIFGMPPNFTKDCVDEGKSKNLQDNVDCLISSQVERNRKNVTQQFLSEYLCQSVNMYTYTKESMNTTWADIRHAVCEHSGLKYVYVTNEVLRGGYVPQVMKEEEKVPKCSGRKMVYCRNDCSGSGKRLLNQQGRQIFDRSLIVFSIVAFLAVY